MSPLLLSVGLIFRTALIVFPGFKKIDIYKIVIALIVSSYAAFQTEAWIFPIFFAFIIALFYREKLIKKLSEGTLFLYGLTALFVLIKTQEIASGGVIILLTLLAAHIGLTAFYCLFKTKPTFIVQFLLILGFLVIDLFLMYRLMLIPLTSEPTALNQLLIGFYGINFVSNIVLLMGFFPIPSKNQSIIEKKSELKHNAQMLVTNFISTDRRHHKIISIVALFISMVTLASFINDWASPVILLLIIGDKIASPGKISAGDSHHNANQ
jgi:hypothetical protein